MKHPYSFMSALLLLAATLLSGCGQRSKPMYTPGFYDEDSLETDSLWLPSTSPGSEATVPAPPRSSVSSGYDDDDDYPDDEYETDEERRLRHYNQGYQDGDHNMFGDSYDGDADNAAQDMDYVDGLFDGHADSFWSDSEPDY